MDTYITKGVSINIPDSIINFIFKIIDNMPKDNLDYLQIFKIEKTPDMGVLVEHRQEQPEFERVYFLLNDEIKFQGKLYLVIEDNYRTLMLADEY